MIITIAYRRSWARCRRKRCSVDRGFHHIFHIGAERSVVEDNALEAFEHLREYAVYSFAQMFGLGVVNGHKDENEGYWILFSKRRKHRNKRLSVFLKSKIDKRLVCGSRHCSPRKDQESTKPDVRYDGRDKTFLFDKVSGNRHGKEKGNKENNQGMPVHIIRQAGIRLSIFKHAQHIEDIVQAIAESVCPEENPAYKHYEKR